MSRLRQTQVREPLDTLKEQQLAAAHWEYHQVKTVSVEQQVLVHALRDEVAVLRTDIDALREANKKVKLVEEVSRSLIRWQQAMF